MKRSPIAALLLLLAPLSVQAQLNPGDILVIDEGDFFGPVEGALFVVDPTTGMRTLLSDFADSSQGHVGYHPQDVDVEASGDILVVDRSRDFVNGDGRLYRIDPSTGFRTVLSDFGNPGQGTIGKQPNSLAVEPSGTILVIDESGGTNSRGALLRVHPLTGIRSVFSDFGNPAQGPFGSAPQEVAVDRSGTILVIDDDIGTGDVGALFRIDPATGVRTQVSDFGNATQGAVGRSPREVAFDGSCSVLVGDFGAGTGNWGELVRVDTTTGGRTLVSDFGNTSLGPRTFANGVGVETSGDILTVYGGGGTDLRGALYRVDPSTGVRVLLSDFGSSAQGPLGLEPTDLAIYGTRPPTGCLLPPLPQFDHPSPVSVAFDGVDTLYFTSFDTDPFIPFNCNNPGPGLDTCDDNFAGRVWSIKTDGTGFTKVTDYPGGVPSNPGELPRNIVAMAYDSSRNGLWLSVSPINAADFYDLDTGQFSPAGTVNFPGEVAGAFNAPNGLAHDPDTDRLWFSEAAGSGGEGQRIFQVNDAQALLGGSLGQTVEFDLNAFPRGGNNGMAWDEEKLWVGRAGSIFSTGFIGTFDPNPLLLTDREGGPTLADAGNPNGLAFDGVTFAPLCALWATPTDGTPTLRAYDVPCPTFEETDVTLPTGTCGEPTPPGSLEVTFQDLGSGLATIFTIGNSPINQNTDTLIPAFCEDPPDPGVPNCVPVGTQSPVTVTVNRIDHNEEARIGLRTLDVQGNPRNAICTIPAGVIPPAFANTPEGPDVVVQPTDDTTGTSAVTLTFDEVTGEGDTTLVTSSAGPAVPSGFQICDPPTYFDLSTTATTAPGSTIEVCIDLAGLSCGGGTPTLQHFEDTTGDGTEDTWVNVTTTVNGEVCGEVEEFSFFGVFIPAEAPALTCDVDGDGDVDRFDVGAIFAARGTAASGPDDPRDSNGDGVITVNDGRICVLECTNASCAP